MTSREYKVFEVDASFGDSLGIGDEYEGGHVVDAVWGMNNEYLLIVVYESGS